MKIIYIGGLFVPSYGGAEISMSHILSALSKLGISITVISQPKYSESAYNLGFDFISCEHLDRISTIEVALKRIKPNWIITQLLWSDVALSLAIKHKIPSIYRACKIPFELNLNSEEYNPNIIISASNYMQKYIREKWNRNSIVINPIIDFQKITSNKENNFDNEYILMFNPIKHKGGEIFKKIALMNPDLNFAIVPGWGGLKKNNEFDTNQIKWIDESLGYQESELPKEIDFSCVPNITILASRVNVAEIYSKAKIVCMPSIWEEVFGRVAIETLYNGIPLIASHVGELASFRKYGAVIIDKYFDINRWCEEINILLDKTHYVNTIKNQKSLIMKHFNPQKQLSELINIIYD
jgi:glycosyltransferase involved in cell wall biosynthesis